MELLKDAHDYATRENAIKALDKALVKLGMTRDDVAIKWFVTVGADGRYSAVVWAPAAGPHFQRVLPLVHLGIGVIG